MAITFPASPADGATYTNPTTGVQYIYNETDGVWKTNVWPTNTDYLQLTGGTLTGDLALGTNDLTAQDITSTTLTTTGAITPGGNIVMASGNGIDFSATGNSSGSMTSELFDDYEEGTFEPIYTSASGDFNTVTYQGDTGGRYIKIGNYVWCTGCARINGGTLDTSNISSGTSLRIGGFPFANESRPNGDSADSPNAVRTVVWSSGSTAPNFIALSPSVNSANLFHIGSIGAVASVNQVSQLGSESMVQFTVTYKTD